LLKTRGPAAADESNTNFTTGIHLGYFVLPTISIGGEIRHQRWISTPAAIAEGGGMPPRTADQESTLRDTTTFAVGPRFHFKLNDKMWVRPGIAFIMPIDKPLSDSKYKMAQLDVPLAF
jgi:long-subunit fatty acid transport protein